MFHRVVIELTDSTPIPTTVLRYDVLHRMQRSAERSHTAVWGFGLANGRLRLVVRGDEANAASLGRRIRVGTRLSLPPSLRPRQSWSLVEPLADADLVAGIAWAHGAVLQHAPTVLASPWSSHRDLLGFRRAPFFDADLVRELVDPLAVHRRLSPWRAPAVDASAPSPIPLTPTLARRVGAAVHGVLPGHWASRRTTAHLMHRAGYDTEAIGRATGTTRRRAQQLLRLPPDGVKPAWASLRHDELLFVP